jgi:spore maturation protein A
MLNYIWSLMIIVGILVASCTGQMEDVSTGILDSSKEAIQLCIMMLGVVGMWSGIMKIAEETGLVRQLTRLLLPVLRVLFPRIAENEEVMGYIAANIIANLLGLGWAATPTGLKAMKALKRLQEQEANQAGTDYYDCISKSIWLSSSGSNNYSGNYSNNSFNTSWSSIRIFQMQAAEKN